MELWSPPTGSFHDQSGVGHPQKQIITIKKNGVPGNSLSQFTSLFILYYIIKGPHDEIVNQWLNANTRRLWRASTCFDLFGHSSWASCVDDIGTE